jgi:hypothetical protein
LPDADTGASAAPSALTHAACIALLTAWLRGSLLGCCPHWFVSSAGCTTGCSTLTFYRLSCIETLLPHFYPGRASFAPSLRTCSCTTCLCLPAGMSLRMYTFSCAPSSTCILLFCRQVACLSGCAFPFLPLCRLRYLCSYPLLLLLFAHSVGVDLRRSLPYAGIHR